MQSPNVISDGKRGSVALWLPFALVVSVTTLMVVNYAAMIPSFGAIVNILIGIPLALVFWVFTPVAALFGLVVGLKSLNIPSKSTSAAIGLVLYVVIIVIYALLLIALCFDGREEAFLGWKFFNYVGNAFELH